MVNITQIRRTVEPDVLKIPGVTGVGQTNRKLRIYVESLNPVEVPEEIGGVPVEVFETGPIMAMNLLNQYPYHVGPKFTSDRPAPYLVPQKASQTSRLAKWRPVPGGVSLGHPKITAGTHGTSLRFLGYELGLSNNHVLAAGSTIQHPQAVIGDPIYQPGPYDGGLPQDAVGSLYDYIPIDEEGVNLVDAALWQPDEGVMADEILEIGEPKGVTQPALNEVVKKSGRTTAYSEGEILDVDATVKGINFGTFFATFNHQIITGHMSAGGDSGSLLLNRSDKAVGLLFAGSDLVTVHNPILTVLDAFKGIWPSPPPQPPPGGGQLGQEFLKDIGIMLAGLLLAS